MKRFFRLVICGLILAVSVMSLTACSCGGKYGTLEVTVAYMTKQTDGSYTETETRTFKVTLYKHLAPKTCKRAETLAKENFWNNAVFYKDTTSYGSQIMFGDLYLNDGNFVLKDHYGEMNVSNYEAEFEKGGVKGSDLKPESGNLGLWRNIDRNSKLSYTSGATFDNGSNTVFMPTTTLSSYEGYFAMFGKLNDKGIEFLNDLVDEFGDSADYTEYTVYSVALRDNKLSTITPLEYEKENENRYQLDPDYPEFNILTKEDYDVMRDDMEEELTGSTALIVNVHTFRIPNVVKVIKSVK